MNQVLLDDPVLKEFKALSTPEKNRYTCDSVFCLYLRDVSRKVCETYYRTVLRFVMLYRECVNEYGWIKRRETLNRANIPEDEDEIVRQLKIKEGVEVAPLGDQKPLQEHNSVEESKQNSQAAQQEIFIPQAEYTSVCNADFMPMVCNDFITEFLEKEHGACTLDKGEAIDLVRNFCHWMSDNTLTCARITMYN